MTGTVQERFEEKFTETEGCWEWEASKDWKGYGEFRIYGGLQLAHRVAYQLYVGEIPEGSQVLHKCDNRGCVRPDHLFLVRKRTLLERFEEKFEKSGGDGCWNWEAGKGRDGYGQFWLDEKLQPAHRIAYQIYIGEAPDGLCVCHHCDNPSCVNPAHLFLGTYADNSHDRDTKDRGVHPDNSGENSGTAKLTEEDIQTIRMMSVKGARNLDLAKQFGVSPGAISHIICGRTWKNV